MGAGRRDIADYFVYEGFPDHGEHANKLAPPPAGEPVGASETTGRDELLGRGGLV